MSDKQFSKIAIGDRLCAKFLNSIQWNWEKISIEIIWKRDVLR